MQNSGSNTTDVQELEECDENEVWIDNHDQLDDYQQQIENYQNENKRYRIYIDLYWPQSFPTVDDKIDLIRMINRTDSDHRVGNVVIGIGDSNEWNNEIIKTMMDRYINVYGIGVDDDNSSVDEMMYGFIKQWIVQQPITMFKLCFYKGLEQSDDGVRLIKECNQLLRSKQCLRHVTYRHDRISENTRSGESKQEVEQLMDEINQL